MGEIEFLPSMHNRGCIDCLNRQQNSLLEFLLGIHTDKFQGCSYHLAKESLNQIQNYATLSGARKLTQRIYAVWKRKTPYILEA